jgi:hypothetical protein
MKITIQDPPEVVIESGPYVIRRPYYDGGIIAVKITAPCRYCGNSVVYYRGAVFSGDKYHDECYRNSGDMSKNAEAFKKLVLGDMTAAEYQKRHGRAWNE